MIRSAHRPKEYNLEIALWRTSWWIERLNGGKDKDYFFHILLTHNKEFVSQNVSLTTIGYINKLMVVTKALTTKILMPKLLHKINVTIVIFLPLLYLDKWYKIKLYIYTWQPHRIYDPHCLLHISKRAKSDKKFQFFSENKICPSMRLNTFHFVLPTNNYNQRSGPSWPVQS